MTTARVSILLVTLLLIQSTSDRGWKYPSQGNDKPALSPPQALVDIAEQAPLIRYNRYIRGGAHTDGAFTGGWQIVLALAAHAGNTTADEKLLEQIAFNLEGSNTISSNGGYPCQHERHMTGTYAILRYTSRFWDGELTQQDRDRIDLIMEASLVASAYTTSDATYAGDAQVTTLDGDTNLHRDWNPNYREGMIGAIMVATVYFGGVDRVYEILDHYDHTTFVHALRTAGLENTYETFTWAANHPDDGAPTGDQIEQHIRNYRYKAQRLQDPMDLYYALTMNTYGRMVNCGINGGRGIEQDGIPTGTLVAGCENLPNKGRPGMLLEFDGRDAGGPRSSIGYAYDGFRPNLTNLIVLVVSGQWKHGDQAHEILEVMKTGVTDLRYKLEHGYRNYSKGQGSTHISDIHDDERSWSYRTTLPLWEEVVKPYLEGQGER